MANINGISLKKIRSFEGEDGAIYGATVYAGKTPVAEWRQGDHGRPDGLTMLPGFSEGAFMELLRGSFGVISWMRDMAPKTVYTDGRVEENALSEDTYRSGALEIFMERLLDMTLTEREYRGFAKEGMPICLLATDGFHRKWVCFPYSQKMAAMTLADIKARWPKECSALADGMFRNKTTEYFKLSGPGDFKLGKPCGAGGLMDAAG